jgi:pimeloyl-ACP methyl ester carboxylesterase
MQMSSMSASARAPASRRLEPLKHIDAGVLNIAYYEEGPATGPAVVLLHGFPYDIHAYVDVAPLLAAQGCRAIIPYLRGYGPTRFRDKSTPRSGEQAAIGADLAALLDALEIRRAIFCGYDWGGRAACVGAALWPERGRAGLTAYRRDVARLLWKQWSPNWHFDDATFERTAVAFDNPDYVDIVIHSYRHRFGLAPGDPQYAELQRRLAELPAIPVPAITLDGDTDGVIPATDGKASAPRFSAPRTHRIVPGAGHNLPQERPEAFASAILELVRPAG